MEFALVYADDWFELPVRLPVGSLTRIDLLVVTDTFGERTVIRPTAEQVPEGEARWSMFALEGEAPGKERILLAPTLGGVLQGPTLEDVLFLRDDMAAMGWAVERTIQGPLDAPVDGYESYLRRLAADPPPPPRTRTADGPEIEYIVGTAVPDNWIPLVPVQTSERSFLFRRGVMGTPSGAKAGGQLLEPPHPFYVADEAVPRAGVQVARRIRRCRGPDGRTWTWMARSVQVGRGPGSSGLVFDVTRRLTDPPSP